MKINKYLIISLILLSCTNESSHKGDEFKNILQIQKRETLVLEQPEKIFGQFVERFWLNEQGIVLAFIDKIQDRVYLFDNKGGFINTIGERNRGPKGILRPLGVAIANNEVIIYDSSQRMLKTFDLNGDLIRSTKLFNDSPFGPIPYQLLYVNDKIINPIIESEFVFSPEKSKLISIHNKEGKLDTLFGQIDPFSKSDKNYNFSNNIYVDYRQNTIYTNLSTSPYIDIYDANTYKKTARFGEITHNFSLPKKEVTSRLPISEIQKRSINVSYTRGLYGTDKYLIQHLQVLTKDWFETADYQTKKNYLVVYDKLSLKLIQEIQINHPLGAVHDNNLYLIEDLNPENFTLGIYEFVSN